MFWFRGIGSCDSMNVSVDGSWYFIGCIMLILLLWLCGLWMVLYRFHLWIVLFCWMLMEFTISCIYRKHVEKWNSIKYWCGCVIPVMGGFWYRILVIGFMFLLDYVWLVFCLGENVVFWVMLHHQVVWMNI